MAFVKRTWLARLGIGLNKFIIGEKDAQNKQTLTNSPDSVTQEGDTISAQNLNDLEDRIEAGLNEKQDALTFDNAPTEGSTNPVTSGGIYTALAGKQATLTFDTVPTSGSTNPVTSGGIYNALHGDPLLKFESNTKTSSTGGIRSHNIDVSIPQLAGYTPIGVVDFFVYHSSGGTVTLGATGARIYKDSSNNYYARISYNVYTSSGNSYSVTAEATAMYMKN